MENPHDPLEPGAKSPQQATSIEDIIHVHSINVNDKLDTKIRHPSLKLNVRALFKSLTPSLTNIMVLALASPNNKMGNSLTCKLLDADEVLAKE